ALPALLEDAARPYRPGDPSDTFPKMFGTRPRPRALAYGRGPAFPSGDNAPAPLAIERKRLPAAWGRRLRNTCTLESPGWCLRSRLPCNTNPQSPASLWQGTRCPGRYGSAFAVSAGHLHAGHA